MPLRHDETQLSLAIADLKSQEHPNYSRTSKKYGIARTTLRDRFTGNSRSMAYVELVCYIWRSLLLAILVQRLLLPI